MRPWAAERVVKAGLLVGGTGWSGWSAAGHRGARDRRRAGSCGGSPRGVEVGGEVRADSAHETSRNGGGFIAPPPALGLSPL